MNGKIDILPDATNTSCCLGEQQLWQCMPQYRGTLCQLAIINNQLCSEVEDMCLLETTVFIRTRSSVLNWRLATV